MPGNWTKLVGMPQVGGGGGPDGCRTIMPGEGPFDCINATQDGLMTTLDAIEPEGCGTMAFQPTYWQAATGGDGLSATRDTLDHTTAHLEQFVAPAIQAVCSRSAALSSTFTTPPGVGTQSMGSGIPQPLGTVAACQHHSIQPAFGCATEVRPQSHMHSLPLPLPPPPPPPAERVEFDVPLAMAGVAQSTPQQAQVPGAAPLHATAAAAPAPTAAPQHVPGSIAASSPYGQSCADNPVKVREAWAQDSILEIFSGSTGRWHVAHVIGVTQFPGTPDVLTLQYYLDDGAKNKSLYRNDHQLALFGVHTAGSVPPGCKIVPSQSRLGQSVFLNTNTGVKYETVEQVWMVYFQHMDMEIERGQDGPMEAPAELTRGSMQPQPMSTQATAFAHTPAQLQRHVPTKQTGGKVASLSCPNQAANASSDVERAWAQQGMNLAAGLLGRQKGGVASGHAGLTPALTKFEL